MSALSVASQTVTPFKYLVPGTAGSVSRVVSDLYAIEPSGIDSLSESWQELAADGPCSAPFYQPEWFKAFAETFEAGSEFVLVSTRNEKGALRGVLPLVRKNRFFKKIPARALRSLSNVHTGRFDLIHSKEDVDSVAAATWKALREAASEWDVVEALDVPAGGAFERILDCAKAEGYLVGTWPTKKSPYLSLPPDKGNPFANCSARFKHFRSGLKGKEKKILKEGPVEVSITATADQETLRTFFTLEAAGWKGANGSAIANHPEQVAFYTRMAEAAAARGRFRIASLTLHGKPIAMQYSLLSGSGYYVCKTTYDEEYRKVSPGQLLVKQMVERLVNEGYDRYDFLGVRSQWKCVWTSSCLEHANCYIFKPTLKGRFLHALTMHGARLWRAIRERVKGDPQEIGVDLGQKDQPEKPGTGAQQS